MGKTYLDDRDEIRGLCVSRTFADILQKAEIDICCFGKRIKCTRHVQRIRLNLEYYKENL